MTLCTRLALAAALALGLLAAPALLPPSPVTLAVAHAAAPGPTKPPRRARRARPQPQKPAPAPKVTPKAGEAPDDGAVEEPTLKRSNRMELDARLVRGEAARSGAVYLFQRAPRRLPPLVDLHQSWLDEIVVPVLGPGARVPAPATAASAPAPAAAP
ncbi:MAG: hypothetical protein CVU56_14470 [Deltaproteobacteria bacterium HGW-Deltaproteobacteria-14]|jgi:hypothetical protein|nr:MAG: hypothetical protein CVU56_14470 [Deltaproteobacteria bacterium HGW-Deltaproteobacteria-14]